MGNMQLKLKIIMQNEYKVMFVTECKDGLKTD